MAHTVWGDYVTVKRMKWHRGKHTDCNVLRRKSFIGRFQYSCVRVLCDNPGTWFWCTALRNSTAYLKSFSDFLRHTRILQPARVAPKKCSRVSKIEADISLPHMISTAMYIYIYVYIISSSYIQIVIHYTNDKNKNMDNPYEKKMFI